MHANINWNKYGKYVDIYVLWPIISYGLYQVMEERI